MTKLNQIYHCEACGNIVQVIHSGAGELVCCGTTMIKLKEQTGDYALEKHVPVIEKKENGFLIKVGDIPHPMDENHHIEWIELIADEILYRKYLQPGDAPEAFFCIDANIVSAREYCNLHKLWGC